MSTREHDSPRLRLIERQARLYGLTTRAVVAATVLGRNRAKALVCLTRLVRQGRLFRHEFVESGTSRRAFYYRPVPKPLGAVALRRCFAILFHCLMVEPRRRLLSLEQGRRLLAALPALRAREFPRDAHVALEPTGPGQPPRVTLFRVSGQASPDDVNLDAVIAHLRRFAACPAFLPWWYFARAERFVLTYLVPGSDNAAKLARRLRHESLVSSVGGAPQAVAVCFHGAQPLYYASV